MRTKISAWAAVLTGSLLVAAPARAGEGGGCDCAKKEHGGHAAAPAAPERGPDAAAGGSAASVRFPDEPLLDQRAAPVRLVTDVIGDRLVVMSFVFTTCTTVCPLLSGIMTGVQDKLGDAYGKEVILVSVTVDPARDTPARLAAYAERWRARAGWTWLTGERDAVVRVLRAAGAYTPSFADHPPMILVGDGRTGRWVRLNGFPSHDRILAAVEDLRHARERLTDARPGGAR